MNWLLSEQEFKMHQKIPKNPKKSPKKHSAFGAKQIFENQ